MFENFADHQKGNKVRIEFTIAVENIYFIRMKDGF
jgi:hypothetical protein